MSSDKITILIADDHSIVRRGLIALLCYEENMEIVGEAENGYEAIKFARELRPEIILMDIALPLLNGIEASRQILSENPKQKIIFLSAHADDGYIDKSIDLGVKGYLVKQCLPEYLIKALCKVSNGELHFSPSVLKRRKEMLQNHIDSKGRVSLKKCSTLTSREAQVLQLVAEGQGNKHIAHILNISIKTVEKHRQNLMRKLYIHDTAGLTRYAISEGFIESHYQRTTDE